MAKRNERGSSLAKAPPAMKIDVNGVAEGLLQDLAFVQESKQKTFCYKRAAEAVFELARPLGDRPDGLERDEGDDRRGPQADGPAEHAGDPQQEEVDPSRSLHACRIGTFRPRLEMRLRW